MNKSKCFSLLLVSFLCVARINAEVTLGMLLGGILTEIKDESRTSNFSSQGREYSLLNTSGRGTADNLVNLISSDGALGKVNQSLVEEIDQLKGSIQERINELKNEKELLDRQGSKRIDEIETRNLSAMAEERAIQQNSQKIYNQINQELKSELEVLETKKNKKRYDFSSEGLIQKFNDEENYTDNQDYSPHELPLETSSDPKIKSEQDRIFGKDSTLLQREVIREKYRSQIIYREVEERLMRNLAAGMNDPVFPSVESFNSFENLSNLYLHYADKYSQNNNELFQENPSLANEISNQMLKQVRSMEAFSIGIVKGVTYSTIDTVKGIIELGKLTKEAVLDPVKTYQLAYNLIESFDSKKCYNFVKNFLINKWDKFKEGDAETKGEMLAYLYAQIFIDVGVPLRGISGLAKMGKEIRLGKSLTRLAEASVGFADELADGAGLASVIEDVSVTTGVKASVAMEIVDSGAKLEAKTKDKVISFANSFRKNPEVLNKIDEITENINKSVYARKAFNETPIGRPAFYINKEGRAIPATAYKHYSSKGKSIIDEIIKEKKIPKSTKGNYLTFEKFDNASEASSKLQVPHDAVYRIKIDTMDNIEDIRIPNGNWGKGDWLEPITKDFSEFGIGGASQAVTNRSIEGIIDVVDLSTGEVLFNSN